MFQAQRFFERDLSALPECLKQWRSLHPRMGVVVYLAEAQASWVTELQACCRSHDVPLVGAVFPGLITGSGVVSRGAWVMRLDHMPPAGLVGGLSADASVAARQVVQGVGGVLASAAASGGTALVVFDAMLPHIASLMTDVARAYAEKLPLVGVNAGSETFQPMPCLFDRDQRVSDGVLCLALPAPSGQALAHGYPVSKALMRASSTQGNRIDTIDGRPALSVYQDIIQREYGVALTRDNFYAYAVHYPFGVITALSVLVRIPVALTDDGAMVCVGEVAPNSALRLLCAPQTPAKSTCVESVASQLGGSAQGGSLHTFYCAGRRMHFGDQVNTELANLQAATGATALVGALTLGELDTLDVQGLKFPQFHNAAVVCMV